MSISAYDTTAAENIAVNGYPVDAGMSDWSLPWAIKQVMADIASDLGPTSSPTFASITVDTDLLRTDTVNGRVGVGTASPSELLHIQSSGPARLRIEADTDNANENDQAQILMSQDGGAVSAQIGFFEAANNKFRISNQFADDITFGTNNTERMRLTALGNLSLGGTLQASGASKALHIFNGTPPTASVTNGVVLYAQDVSGSSELKVRDEAGNTTTLSPHNFSHIPGGASEPMAWAHYCERDGQAINVDMLALARAVESLTGEKLVHVSKLKG